MQHYHLSLEDLVKDSDKPRLIEANIIDYVVWLKEERKLSSVSIELNLAAIMHFYSMNDILLNRKKIGRYIGEHVKHKDRDS